MWHKNDTYFPSIFLKKLVGLKIFYMFFMSCTLVHEFDYRVIKAYCLKFYFNLENLQNINSA